MLVVGCWLAECLNLGVIEKAEQLDCVDGLMKTGGQHAQVVLYAHLSAYSIQLRRYHVIARKQLCETRG